VVEPFPPPPGYTPDPALRGGAAPAAIRSSVTNDNSRMNTSSVDVVVDGVTVNGIARGIGKGERGATVRAT
jgi:hypothetical protein